MITTDQCCRSPDTTHAVNVVDTSSSVNRESHFGANMVNAHVNSSRSAMVDSTHAFMAGEVLPPIRPTFFTVIRITDLRGADAIN